MPPGIMTIIWILAFILEFMVLQIPQPSVCLAYLTDLEWIVIFPRAFKDFVSITIQRVLSTKTRVVLIVQLLTSKLMKTAVTKNTKTKKHTVLCMNFLFWLGCLIVVYILTTRTVHYFLLFCLSLWVWNMQEVTDTWGVYY